jgi:hypothetical protein
MATSAAAGCLPSVLFNHKIAARRAEFGSEPGTDRQRIAEVPPSHSPCNRRSRMSDVAHTSKPRQINRSWTRPRMAPGKTTR